jgi:hypothetical protein
MTLPVLFNRSDHWQLRKLRKRVTGDADALGRTLETFNARDSQHARMPQCGKQAVPSESCEPGKHGRAGD